MQDGKVKIADGLPETRAHLENFKSKMKLETPLKKITMGDAVDFAITQAEKVPALEARIRELEEQLNYCIDERDRTEMELE